MANIVVDTFVKGGPVMWPILVTSLTAASVVAERAIWWIGTGAKRESKRLEQVYAALEQGDLEKASRQARDTKDPVLQVVWHGLNHHHTSLQNALQVSAGVQIESAGRFLGVLDTIITLAPLLGLLGTVTGIMEAFRFVGSEDLQAIKVSGGVAEALIATSAGLAIAIFTLIPYNYFSSRVAKLTFEIQTAATNVEVLLEAGKKNREANRNTNSIPAHEAALSHSS
ncbi:outer membrane transport energization protein ExbB [Verrucomicrobium sp. GAS474]|uniref:MotA/TolQ/ExbB proton channel family protein n=1 Tax=Verrucomicrobium sp. GAS474 TaxID=1882831 RepID=UPI00087D26C7|nr:MotA/TolQ/ExbB proton channel family protein [Verrucomicrobium sp. GAS474]SDT85815.1 outer membrane transport energization protein ExbB [Verrucomicrobium sp. GAS474]